MNLPLVKIVVPFAWNESEKGSEFETELRESLLGQLGYGESFDIRFVFVLQEKDGKIHKLQDWGPFESETVIFKADGYDHPTTFHQAGDGFGQCLDAEYCMYIPSNDILAPMFIASAIQRMKELSAKVVYGDTLFMTPEMKPRQCDKPEKEFLPLKWFETRSRRISNPIPDVCLIDCSILEVVPFESKYRRAAFAVWWYRIWEKYGHLAFAYVNTIGCMFRPHHGHLSDDSEWVQEGYEIMNVWLEGRPWHKWTGYA